MQVNLALGDGTIQKVNIGYGIIPAASEFLRKERMSSFEATLDLLAKHGDPETSKESILNATKDYQKNQIPTDGEIREWLVTPHGVQFAVSHGSKKTSRWTIAQAEDVLDELDEECYVLLIRAINVVASGQDAVNFDDRLRKASKMQFERRLEEMERLAADPVNTQKRNKKHQDLLDHMPGGGLFGKEQADQNAQ